MLDLYDYESERDESRLATVPEAVAEWTLAVGAENPDRAWILSNYDSWSPNPFYHGPPQRHPEEDPDENGSWALEAPFLEPGEGPGAWLEPREVNDDPYGDGIPF